MADEEGSAANLDNQLMTEVKQRDEDVRKLLVQRNKAGALSRALSNPPVTAKNNEVKDANVEIVNRAISAIPDSELSSIISALDNESCDILTKYCYRNMENSINCAAMLKIHALVVEKNGVGTIMRATTDRKTV
mmetsp:Transcript_9822/g.9922  ORF Transcript_9822/g.9922 Transcript_9822/m.9922 type:complete len:134 (-) Transcript_9822:230-631(-)|eukprot:CAMPEP_0182419252 /NCGR_PEP_ID=MMETSP1167-20130531/3690_1 /TAXON_ID=2988 /ORGANISM="Mallomonas Sp, Strain CCMP3275" /LENGTH=133 /DNA_ID=CAMNT_0024594019 /DNA_START=88 /DNA_END=489 /DNA_ORIENTATION=+